MRMPSRSASLSCADEHQSDEVNGKETRRSGGERRRGVRR
jgi:hypothetical protein